MKSNLRPVRSGDLVIPAWNAVVEALLSLVLLPGRGILLGKHPQGTTVSARKAGLGFRGAFWASSAGDRVSFSQGFVNGEEPLLGEKKVSEAGAYLEVRMADVQPGKPKWLCLRVRVDAETGRMKSGKGITENDLSIEARSTHASSSADGLTGYHPVAVLIRDPESNAVRLRQIGYFSYQHSTARKPEGSGRGFSHYFHAA